MVDAISMCWRRRQRVDNADDDGRLFIPDDDVQTEQLAIMANDEKSVHALVVRNIVKQYARTGRRAVAGVTFGVDVGECFGLLGVNGAGKSTLFSMLTGYASPTTGDALIDGRNVHAASDCMSYCPQHDVLIDWLTPGEHVQLYARIRGMRASDRARAQRVLIDRVGLTTFERRQSQYLSGGNKRKLQFIIAMINTPKVRNE
jgi:ABC-type multidrug transport system ATPase subunit